MTKDFYFDVTEVQEILLDNNKINELPIDNTVKQLLMAADKKVLLKNAELHMAKIAFHSDCVREFCEKAGIPERGAKHDNSKWSPQELFESIYFFQGTRSPIDRANEVLGWSPAFNHHVESNDHHLEASVKLKETGKTVYETENAYINGGTVIRISDGAVIPKDELMTEDKPIDVAIETICDFCGAAKAYL